ncbi:MULTISPECIES: hypothetical protein [unclassified Knoellia]|uniref:hypothetical protein n=1 Tax=Knoellia altitudinis TaxID=3404795 RepID=UPI00360D9269
MTDSSAYPRPRHANSPFRPQAEVAVEQFAAGDRVCHDAHGLGRVLNIDAGGATVDFDGRTLRIETPFRKMTKL